LVSKAVLEQAKSFLCWDLYRDLSIKLIAIETATAFFYPPTKDLSTIIIFYKKNCTDFSEPVFLLFHEVGHFEQYKMYQTNNKINEFRSLINLDKGPEKIKFEREAWDIGKEVMKKFIKKYQSNNLKLLDHYFDFADICLMSYSF